MRRQAFTLIELLVVIAIIGILSALVVTQLGASQIKARNATAQSDIAEMGKAVDAFRTDDAASGAVVSNPPSGTVDTLSGTSGTLPILFTGTQNIQGLTYAAPVQKTPSLAYTYRYYASGTASSVRQLVQGASNQPEYALCSNLVNALSPAACVQDGSGAQPGTDQVTAASGQGLLSPAGSSGLVAWYQLEGSGGQASAADASSNGNTGTLNNFSFDGTTNGWTVGKYGKGLMFDGSPTRGPQVALGIARPAFQFGQGSFSISAWINPTSAPIGYSTVFGVGAQTVNSRYGLIYNNNSSNNSQLMGFVRDNSNNTVNPLSVEHVPYGTFSHVAMIVNRTTNLMDVYLNGVKTSLSNVSLSGLTDMVSPQGGGTIGGIVGGGGPNFNGIIDDVRVYNRALSASEVQQLYQGTL